MTTIERPINAPTINTIKPRLKGSKRSTNARRVAEKVIERVGKGLKVSVGEVMREVGYSDAMALNPKKVTEQQEYKDAIESWAQKVISVRDKAILELKRRDLSQEKLRDVTEVVKVTDHSTALAQGTSTENIATKGVTVVFGSDDFLALQVKKQETA